MKKVYLYEGDRNFTENYLFNSEYDADVVKFLMHLCTRNDIKNQNKLYIYELLIVYGYIEYIEDVISLTIPEYSKNELHKAKIYCLSNSLMSLHKRKTTNSFNCDGIPNNVSIHTESIESYKNYDKTPDLIFDNDCKTVWRIHNINNIQESTAYISSYNFTKKKYTIKILTNNIPENILSNECNPKKVRFSLIGQDTKKVYECNEYQLKNISGWQTIDFNMSIINMVSNYFQKHELFVIKFEILEYHQGKNKYCDIAEMRIYPH